jgi:hypothetical protein
MQARARERFIGPRVRCINGPLHPFYVVVRLGSAAIFASSVSRLRRLGGLLLGHEEGIARSKFRDSHTGKSTGRRGVSEKADGPGVTRAVEV